ncbi:hypothetical protein P3L10_025835 [Capsicum annuum]
MKQVQLETRSKIERNKSPKANLKSKKKQKNRGKYSLVVVSKLPWLVELLFFNARVMKLQCEDVDLMLQGSTSRHPNKL